MDKTAPFRKRLAGLTTEGVESLAACRTLQDRLRELKREVLDQLLALRAKAQERAGRSLGIKPSPGERRDEGARKLLEDVRERVTGLLDNKSAAAVEEWAEINREIDARLERLAKLELKLARAAGEADAAAPAADRTEEASDDDLYAKVGAAARKGPRRGAFCPHCGQGVEPDDRFCRHCGHRLR